MYFVVTRSPILPCPIHRELCQESSKGSSPLAGHTEDLASYGALVQQIDKPSPHHRFVHRSRSQWSAHIATAGGHCVDDPFDPYAHINHRSCNRPPMVINDRLAFTLSRSSVHCLTERQARRSAASLAVSCSVVANAGDVTNEQHFS